MIHSKDRYILTISVWSITALILCLASYAWAAVPRAEHPRPDQFRENWISLNGEWQFDIDEKADGEMRGLTHGKELPMRIIVPFCPESKLSGLAHTAYMTDVWYRRLVQIPVSMKGKRILLHFGGVDYKTWVYVNGKLAGTHIGENAAFAFDITSLLKERDNEIVVKVYDNLRSGIQPGGKQAFDKSEGCVYTRTTGIWQTVWLEAVGSSYLKNITVIPNPDHSSAKITADVDGLNNDLKLKVEALIDGKVVGSATSSGLKSNQLMELKLKEKKLWEPGSPFLYDLKLTLTQGGKIIDELKSYFGLRKVTVEGRRILINDKPVFQRLILDQGFYPDGIWTAPTDEALKHDIEMSMAAGYNGARLHQKVFEPRFLYWADKLGYLVWGEFPNWGYNYSPAGYDPLKAEWAEIMQRDMSHPAIIGWCPFNESGNNAGEIQQIVWKLTRTLDPTRPVIESSGWVHTVADPQVLDAHDYDQNPATYKKRWMDFFQGAESRLGMPPRYGVDPVANADRGVPFMVSEFGGIGWATEGGWGYGAGPKNEAEFYSRYKGLCDALLDNPNMFGFCYTQLTDVEQEHNGLYYYDRRPKFDMKKIHDSTARKAVYEEGVKTAPQPGAAVQEEWKVIVGAVQDGPLSTPYRYSVEAPAAGWNQIKFDDSSWKTGIAPFGRDGSSDGSHPVKTEWLTSDLVARKTFQYSEGSLKKAAIVISYDEDTEVFVNGKLIFSSVGYIDNYKIADITAELKAAIKSGVNTLAVHTHQTIGGQYMDLALLVK